jgi:hypothetical protein
MPRSYQVTLALLEPAAGDTTFASQPQGDTRFTGQPAAGPSLTGRSVTSRSSKHHDTDAVHPRERHPKARLADYAKEGAREGTMCSLTP